MDDNVFKLIDELHKYTADPNRKVFAAVEIEHINAVLGTLVALYTEEPQYRPDYKPEATEARRPPRSLPKRPWWKQLLP